MRRLTENLSPADRRFYWKFVGSLFGFYGALIISRVASSMRKKRLRFPILQPAVAETIGERLPAGIEAPMPLRHAAKSD